VSLFFAIVLLSGAQAENLVRRGLYHAAEARAARAAQTAWLDRDLWVTLGKIREGLAGEPPDQRYLQSAIEAYEYAITCARTDPAGYIGAARCYRLAGNTHSAVSLARSAALLYPNGPPALLELARCLEQAGDAQGALAVYRRIVALSDKPYGQYPALEGWADYRIAVAAAAVARSSGGKDANAMWRIAGNILSASLSWAKTYGGSLEMAGRADPRLQAELESLALDAARALAVTGQAGDAEMAENLRKLVQR
jgi:tetratricopeptide (TPR) repeat protein